MSRTEDSMSAAQDLNSRASREISALEADQRSLTSEISALRADIEKANGAKVAALQAKEDAISKAIQFGVSAQTTSMTSKNTGAVSNYHYKLLPGQRETESVGYFVLEHQPQSCDELPPNGIVKWTNITVEVNNKPVAEPLFVAKQESPTLLYAMYVVNIP